MSIKRKSYHFRFKRKKRLKKGYVHIKIKIIEKVMNINLFIVYHLQGESLDHVINNSRCRCTLKLIYD